MKLPMPKTFWIQRIIKAIIKGRAANSQWWPKKDPVSFPPFYSWLPVSFHLKSSLEIRISLYSLSHLDLTGVWQKPRRMSPNLLFNGLACEGLLTKWQNCSPFFMWSNPCPQTLIFGVISVELFLLLKHMVDLFLNLTYHPVLFLFSPLGMITWLTFF